MKVLQVSKLYYPWIGGVEKVVQNIAESLKNKVSMSLLVCQPRDRGGCSHTNGVEVHRAGSIGICFSMPVSLSFPFLFRTLSQDKDIIHFHTPFLLGVISYLLTKPKGKLVVWWHSDIVRQKKTLWLYKPFLLKFLGKADRIIVATAEQIENSAFLRAFRDKCEIIPFGIDTRRFELSTDLEEKVGEIRKRHDAKIVLFVGRLGNYKGLKYLIRAMQDVNGRPLIIGQGTLENKLRQLVTNLQLKDKIVFLGNVDSQDMIAYYHSCEVFVLPSTESTEAFGIVQLEAMACGKPVVNKLLLSYLIRYVTNVNYEFTPTTVIFTVFYNPFII
jgi:rhamnosyl/mannosyltransferase